MRLLATLAVLLLALPLVAQTSGDPALTPAGTRRFGAMWQADQLSSGDIGAQLNTCITLSGEARHKCDAQALPLLGTIGRQVNVGFNQRLYGAGRPAMPCSAVASDGLEYFDTSKNPRQQYHCLNGAWSPVHTLNGDNALGNQDLILPHNSLWRVNIPAQKALSGIVQYDGTNIEGSAFSGGGEPMRILGTPGQTLDSLYRTEPSPKGGGSYVRTEGMKLDGNGASFTTAVMRWDNLFDESELRRIFATSPNGVALESSNACCGAFADDIAASGEYGANNSLPYKGDIPAIYNATFNAAGNGKPNVQFYDASGTIGVSPLMFNVYMETNGDKGDFSTPAIDNVTTPWFGGHAPIWVGGGPNNLGKKPLWANPKQPFLVSMGLLHGGNNFIGNLRTGGSAGMGDANSFYDPRKGYEGQVRPGQVWVGHVQFTPAAPGWYTVYAGSIMQGGFSIQSSFGDQDIEGFVNGGKYNSPPSLTITETGFLYGGGEMDVDQIAAGYDARGRNALYVHVVAGGNRVSVNLYGQGMDEGAILTAPRAGTGPISTTPYATVNLAKQAEGTSIMASGSIQGHAFHETLTTPASSKAPCRAGDFTDDANYHYVCVAANTWKRTALSSF